MATADPPASGLTSAEVADRVARGLVNIVPSAPTRTVRQIVRANVFTPVNLIVLILAALVILAGSPKDALFGFVIVANSVIGIFQEVRAKQSLDKLRVVNAPKAHALRDGQIVELQTEELVHDDVVELRAGAQIVADGEVLTHDNLEIDESLLTGEADPIVKVDGRRGALGQRRRRRDGSRADHQGRRRQLRRQARRGGHAASRSSTHRCATTSTASSRGSATRSSRSACCSRPASSWRRDQSWQEAIIQTVAGLVGMVPEGLDPADQRRVRRRRRAARQAQMPRPGVAGDRGARPRRRAVRRQDRNDHRRVASRSPRCASSATPTRSRSTHALARDGRLRSRPERHAQRGQGALRRRQRRLVADRPGAVLQRPQVERDVVRGRTAAGCSARPSSC